MGTWLCPADLEDVARRRRRVVLEAGAREKVQRARHAIEQVAGAGDSAPRVYGVNTGFGALAETRISASEVRRLQKNLVRSHSTGVGPDMPEAAVRGMMLLRAQTLALGHSGVRVEVIELLCQMLERNVVPRVPAQGSVGASGDLAPLAHLALAMIGEGEARVDGEPCDGGEALRRAGLVPLELEAKEGLALINGTQYMTAYGVLALCDAAELLRVADIAGAMSLDALKGSARPFQDRLMKLRPHPGQATVAENLRKLLSESASMESHHDCNKVQDPYSLRCMPQVHGASRDALGWAREVLEREINSATDNPSVFVEADGRAEVVSGGNFHGQPVAYALDLAAIALAELGNISERRVEQLVNPALSSGLTPFLAKNSGLESGFMIAQVASASLVSENKVLCHPASVDSIPSSAGKEDHVSMGSIGARKLEQVVENVRRCLAIELLTAAQGLEQRKPLSGGQGVEAAHAAVRARVPALDDDRPLYRDIEAVAELIRDGSLSRQVSGAVNGLA
ncbi:MAG: histidine ammonia-lyase [Sorangiineae bacterium PRO1]|nr:histidine ammonia-lyase [Sorangiineae bacterium PRO1]